jgi:hypothetical protein
VLVQYLAVVQAIRRDGLTIVVSKHLKSMMDGLLPTQARAPRGCARSPLRTTRAVAAAPPQQGRLRNYGCSDGSDVSKVDVAVIGSGIAGLCAASLLARFGLVADRLTPVSQCDIGPGTVRVCGCDDSSQ